MIRDLETVGKRLNSRILFDAQAKKRRPALSVSELAKHIH